MQFIYPGFLFALSALAIPVIIHLFNFRKFKRIYFTNVKFLREIKQETQSKSQLKHLLILLARMLAITFLVFAFAQPFIPVAQTTNIAGDKVVSIFIDNSFSMDAQGKAGSLLEQAKKNATEIVAAYKPADRFQLLTNDFEGKHQRLVNREEFLEALQEVKSSAAVRSVSEIISRQADILNSVDAGKKTAYLLSDFQKTNFELSNIKNDSSIQVILLPLEGNTKNNLYIDSCWFEIPSHQIDKPQQLFVRVSNASDQAVENVPVKLFINKEQKGLTSFSLEANSNMVVKLTFTCKEIGIQNAQLQLNDYPVSFDDSYFFSFEIAKRTAILCINEAIESNSINALFTNDSAFSLANVAEKNIDYASLPKYNLILLNELNTISSGLAQELKRFVNNGGSLMVFPSKEIDMDAYRNFLISMNSNYFTQLDTAATRVDKVNIAHPLYNEVFDKKRKISESMDLPQVLKHYSLTTLSHTGEEYLMRLQNGSIFLSKTNFGKGQLYLSAVPLDNSFSNFTKHAMFVPSIYNIALYSIRPKKLFYTLGKDEPILIGGALPGEEEVYHLKSNNGIFDIVPEHKIQENGMTLNLHNQIKTADSYLLTAGKDSLLGLSFNYDRKESNLNCFDKTALEEQINKLGFANFSLLSGSTKDIETSLRELNQGKRYWKWCIVLTLLFLGLEGALIRFWK